MVDVTLDQIETASFEALRAHGAADWIAASVARAVRRAEETGNIICGLYYLDSYCVQLSSGRVDGQVEPVVTAPRPGSVKSDARFGFAQPAFERALPKALDVAREMGTASLAVAHSHTCTSLGYFTEQIAGAGFVALGFTNASPAVAAPGSGKKVIGTNPIALSVPDGAGNLALHFDFSTSAVALGKITMAKAAGEEIPLGWAVDSDGNPTTDPDAALKGALVSAGAHKGWGIGLMVEVMAAAMTGSVNSLDTGALKSPEGPPHGLGQFYVILDPGTYTDAFGDRIARLAEAIADDPAARLPGQGRKSLSTVTVDNEFWHGIRSLGDVVR